MRIDDRPGSGLVSVSAERVGDTLTVLVAGELDIASCGEVEAVIRQLPTSGAHEVVIDLRGLRVLDSSGVRVLVLGRRLATAASIRYRVTHVYGMPRQVLAIVGALEFLTEPQ